MSGSWVSPQEGLRTKVAAQIDDGEMVGGLIIWCFSKAYYKRKGLGFAANRYHGYCSYLQPDCRREECVKLVELVSAMCRTM